MKNSKPKGADIFNPIMKHLLTILTLLLTATLTVRAQNNPYALEDGCYRLFVNTEKALATDRFSACNDSLLHRALLVGDTKAEVLYYVERLKNLTRQVQRKPTSPTQDSRIDAAMRELMQIAEKKGYMQYYYYAYEMVQTHYFNHGFRIKGMEIINRMQEDAHSRHDAYGLWTSQKYMTQLYLERGDYINAKYYIKRALHIYETTVDPTIKRQSAARLYCDLSDTYPVNSDSMRINIRKAAQNRREHMDSVRVAFYESVLYALDKDIPNYQKTRDFASLDDRFYMSNLAHPVFYKTIDQIMAGEKVEPEKVVDTLITTRNVKFIANIAEVYGLEDLSFQLEKKLVNRMENRIASIGMGNLAEFNARMGNDTLTSELQEKRARLASTMTVIAILIGIILLGVLIFTFYQIRGSRRRREKDAAQIAQLQEANEKVKMANEAKTRFIQNMSHEVRTPLNAIVGFSQLLSLPDGTFPEEEKEEFAAHIVNNTKMLTMLLDDILNASAMDSGKYRISLEDGEVHYICQAAISSAEHRLQPGVRMFYVPEQEEPFHFTTDPRRVQQILINLLTNACKHTSQGEIRLASSLSAHPGEVTFTVTDTGPGVPEDQAEAIFDRFKKLNEFVQGTGLGLSICRDIAARMGGRVYLDTTYKEGGARFVFVVPVTPPDPNNPKK